MERQSIETIIAALASANVRYLVVGGVAVVAHGHVRFTADLDLVLDPDPASLRRAVDAIAALGYRPRAPVPISEFADARNRRRWSEEKGMTVFSMASAEHPATELDLFLEPPFDFEATYERATVIQLGTGAHMTFVSRRDLIALKRAVGRPQDLLDAQALESLDDATGGESV